MTPPVSKPKAVIVISSHVVRGTVGNRAAVFALETLGFNVWALPTVVLPWHPGHGLATRIVPPADKFAALTADLANAPWIGEVGAVLSGYLGDAAQADAVAGLVASVKRHNPDALYVCDPVIGDSGGLYVPEATAVAMRDRLMPLADIATPNRYELAWLTGRDLHDVDAIRAAARHAGPATMLVTSAPGGAAASIGNLLISGGTELLAGHPQIANPPNGVGDLTAAVFLARLLSGAPIDVALTSTTASVYEVLSRASARGGDELQLETDAPSLHRPGMLVSLRDFSLPQVSGRNAPAG